MKVYASAGSRPFSAALRAAKGVFGWK